MCCEGYCNCSVRVCVCSNLLPQTLESQKEVPTVSLQYRNDLKMWQTGGSDRKVGELLKYGGSGMVDLLTVIFSYMAGGDCPQAMEGGPYC